MPSRFCTVSHHLIPAKDLSESVEDGGAQGPSQGELSDLCSANCFRLNTRCHNRELVTTSLEVCKLRAYAYLALGGLLLRWVQDPQLGMGVGYVGDGVDSLKYQACCSRGSRRLQASFISQMGPDGIAPIF